MPFPWRIWAVIPQPHFGLKYTAFWTTIGRSMLVCKMFCTLLPPLITSIDYTSPALTQQSFEQLATKFPNLVYLDISLEYDDNQEEVDWSRVRLPELRTLRISCCPLKSIDFNQNNTPQLKHLSLSNSRGARCNLDLPVLSSIDIEHTQVPTQKFPNTKLHAVADSVRMPANLHRRPNMATVRM